MSDERFQPIRRLLLKGGVAGALAAATSAQAQPEATKRRAQSSSADAAAKPGAADISPVMRTISAYIAEAVNKPLPDTVIEATKHHLLDTLAAMISGARLLPGQKAIAYVKQLGGTPEACVPGTRIITNVVNAAFAGGMLAHADETDDAYPETGTHPGAAVVPSALAIAERRGLGGTPLLRAIALGYDMCERFSFALGAMEFRAAGHDTYGYASTFGAAAAAAAIAGLDADQVRYVLSYAAQQASGVPDYPRDTQHIEKAFNFAGRPARNGVASATMVAIGMTGIDDVFSGDKNFFAAFKPTVKPDELTRGLGQTYAVMKTSIKKWSVGNPAQAALDSLEALIKTNNLKAADIDKVVVRLDHAGANTVNNRSMADINMQYLAAAMLLDGTLTFVAAHDVKRMQDPRVLELRRRVELYGDDEMDRVLPSRHAIVELKLRDGRELRHKTTEVRGTPLNPMTREEVGAKAQQLMEPALGKKRARDLIETVWRIEQVGNLRALRPLLRT